jgi:ABC-type uncharacterized transport system YnjBCD ATPase subunit
VVKACLTFFTKPNCPLCDEALEQIELARQQAEFDLLEVNILSDPAVMLMDEPFAALDAQTREILQSEVERIWSELTRSLPFLTVCSYPIDCFQDEGSRKLFPSVCAEHAVVSHALNA